MTDLKDNNRLTRREFLIFLEGLAGAVVAGWLIPKSVSVLSDREPLDRPELLDCLAIRAAVDGTELIDTSSPGEPALVCKVNEIGGTILVLLDGHTTFAEIVQKISSDLGRQPSNPEVFTSRMATFIAGLGEAGFLKRPFYINIITNTMVS